MIPLSDTLPCMICALIILSPLQTSWLTGRSLNMPTVPYMASLRWHVTFELWLKRWGTESNIIIPTQQTAAYCIVQQTGMIPLKLNRESIRLQERERVRAERDVELLLFSMISTAAVFFQWGMGSRCHKQLNQTLQFLQAEKKQRQYAFKYPGFASILCSAFRVFMSPTYPQNKDMSKQIGLS